MTPEQLTVICESFDKACSTTPDLGVKFYNQLSDDYPETMAIFNSVNMGAQHTRFVSMLSIILHRMKDERQVTSLLQDLGRQHHRFGIKERDFKVFGATLMTVLNEVLGSEFDEDKRVAWNAVYREVTLSMKSAGD